MTVAELTDLKTAINWLLENGEFKDTETSYNIAMNSVDMLEKQLSIPLVVSSDNKAVALLHKLMVKYHNTGLELEKRKEAVTDVNDLNVIDLQIRTNKSFLEDIMQTAGALL